MQKKTLKKKKITCFSATHDSVDALSFSDETIVLYQGRIMEKGPSADVYKYPLKNLQFNYRIPKTIAKIAQKIPIPNLDLITQNIL